MNPLSNSLITKRRLVSRWESKNLYAIPALLLIVSLSIFPLIQLVRMSFGDVSIGTLSKKWRFIGFENFRAVTSDPNFGQILSHTVIFVGIVAGVGIIGGFAAALVINDVRVSSNFLLALMVFIWALPPIVNGSVWKFLLGGDGLVNTLLMKSSLVSSPVPFLYDTKLALYSVAIVNCWAVIPFNALVLRAAFMNIPKETTEAAQLDGVSSFQEVRHIIIPSVRPTILVLFILTVVYGFRSFDFIYVMTYGGPGNATNTLPFLGYLKAFVLFKFGEGSAIALISVLFTSVLALVYAKSVRKEEEID
jgi:multiple sugar transport system permease protein